MIKSVSSRNLVVFIIVMLWGRVRSWYGVTVPHRGRNSIEKLSGGKYVDSNRQMTDICGKVSRKHSWRLPIWGRRSKWCQHRQRRSFKTNNRDPKSSRYHARHHFVFPASTEQARSYIGIRGRQLPLPNRWMFCPQNVPLAIFSTH